MQQNSFTMMVPIIPEKLDLLKGFLTDNRKNILNGFKQSKLTHMGSFIIVPKDQKCGARLLFTSFYDEDEATYLADLKKQLKTYLDQIWMHCKGYDHTIMDNASKFDAFIKMHSLKASLFSNALPGVSKMEVNESESLRRQVDHILDSVPAGTKPIFAKQVAFSPLKKDPPSDKFLPKIIRWLKESPLKAVQGLAGIHPKRLNDPTIPFRTKPGLYEAEDVTTQNILTVIVPFKPSFLSFRLGVSKGVFAYARSDQARNAGSSRFGRISNLTTIHLMRWTITDGGQNLLFQSVYDGSWESYIDDFVDIVALEMNCFWGNCTGYPVSGAQDIEYFKNYIRSNQLAAHIAYLAYPHLSLTNILTNLSMSGNSPVYSRKQGVQRYICGSYRS